MVKLLSICLGFIMSINIINYNSIQEAILSADDLSISYLHNEYSFEKEDKEFVFLMNVIDGVLRDSHQVPALGVALHDEVIREKENRNWIEFGFSAKVKCNDMEFDGLLVFLDKDMGGVNIYRRSDGKYEGRCFYINLNIDISGMLL